MMPESSTARGVPGLSLVQSELGRVRTLMAERMQDLPVPVDMRPLLTYLEDRTGKMIRPALVILAGRCLGPVTGAHRRAAAVMEMIHGATLLHDDVIDESQRRRGADTANHRWGNETAVLLGDFVLTHVLRLCVDLDRPVARIVADTAAQVCRGELRQTLDPDGRELDEDRYVAIITDKSAAFFSGCCRIGALLSGGTEAQVQALADYGLQMGVAFQMADDLIDVSGCETQAGKPVGQDAHTHLTLPVIHWLASLGAPERVDVDLRDRVHLREELERSGSLDYVRTRCAQATETAVGALTPLNDTEAKAALIALARYAGDRSV